MAFKTAVKPTFTASVSIPVPGESDSPMTVTFLHKRKTELREWIDASKDKDDLAALIEVMQGWDADSTFSESALRNLLEDFPGAALALYRAYIEESTGAARKN